MDTGYHLFNWRQLGFFSLLGIAAICTLVISIGSVLGGGDSGLALRNADYPRTYIKSINVDLTSPNHWVRLTWTGPYATEQETGPFYSSPGAGFGTNDCDCVAESNISGSNCTPKGTRFVEGFSDYLPTHRDFRFVTWFDKSRRIGFHAHWEILPYPSSRGCVRLQLHAAQLIHNNSITGETQVIIDGKWTRPPVR